MRRDQSCHNYTCTICPLPAKETERPRPPLSPACFAHKRQQIYRELFPLPPSLGKIQAERQPLILCVGIKVVTTTHVPFALSRQETERPRPPLSTACFTHKCPQIYRELFALQPSLGKIQEERQSLILCVHVRAVKPAHPPLEAPRNPPNSRDPHAAICSTKVKSSGTKLKFHSLLLKRMHK